MDIRKLLLATTCGAILLTAVTGIAQGRNLSTSSTSWRAVFFETRLRVNEVTYLGCQITFEGSFHSRTIAKRLGSLIGYVSSSTLGPCGQFTSTILRETLPWHLTYEHFTGTLPNITSIAANIVGFSFKVREAVLGCLGRSTSREPLRATFVREIVSGGRLTSLAIGGGISTDCGWSLELPGSGRVTVLNTTTTITVTLI